MGNILWGHNSPVCLLPLLLQLCLGQAAALDQSVKLGLGGGLGFLGDVGQRGDSLEVNSKSGQHGGEVPGLKVQLLTLIGQREDAELAVFKLLPGLDDVGEEEGQAAIIVQPPHVNGAGPLLLPELDDLVHRLVVQGVALNATVHCGGDLPCPLDSTLRNCKTVRRFLVILIS